MNKLILIDLIKTHIELYIDGKLDLETITQTFYNNQSKEIDQNKIVQKETELIVYLYQKLPYFKIKLFLNMFGEKIDEVCSLSYDPKIHYMGKIINGYILDLKSIIKERDLTEVDLHLLIIAKEYYNGTINIEKQSSLIKKNLSKPEELMSLDIADSNNYEQITLFALKENNIDLKDSISKSNYYKKEDIKKRLIKFIISTFSKDDYKIFLKTIYDILDSLEEQLNIEELIQLYKLYEKELTLLYRKIHDNLKSTHQKNKEMQLVFKKSVI